MAAVLRMIDVSDPQRTVDWKAVRRSGVRVVACKCSEGEDFVARTWSPARVKAIRAAGLKLMPYHYLRFRRDRTGAVEARHAVATATAAGWRPGRHGRRGDLPMCVDTERGSNEAELAAMTGDEARIYVGQFTAEVRRLTGRGCITYLSPGFAAELGGRAPRHGRHCWVADWDAPDGRPNVPRGFGRRMALVHQTSDAGRVPGVSTAVDLDLFLGGAAKLAAYARGIDVRGPRRPPAPDPIMNARRAQFLLRRVGWPIKIDGRRGPETARAVRDFQRGYARRHLRQDGLVGPATAAALEWSAEHGGLASDHFEFREFADHRTGWIKTHRALVLGLEELRRRVGHPIGVLSGFRDPSDPTSGGIGASKSQHKFGNAIDPTARLPLDACRACRAFSGIGKQPRAARGQEVRHLDVRHVGPNFTGGTVDNPTEFDDVF